MTTPSTATPHRWSWRRPRTWIVALTVVILLISSAVGYHFRHHLLWKYKFAPALGKVNPGPVPMPNRAPLAPAAPRTGRRGRTTRRRRRRLVGKESADRARDARRRQWRFRENHRKTLASPAPAKGVDVVRSLRSGPLHRFGRRISLVDV